MSKLGKDMTNKSTFSDHMWAFNKYGFTLIELVLGYDLGLFEILKDANKPLTSIEIAEQAGCKERYVREWLGAVSAAQVVELHVHKGMSLYSLSDEHYGIVKSAVAYGRGLSVTVGRLGVIKACFQKQGPMGDPNAFGREFDDFFGEVRTQMVKTDIQQELFPNIEKEIDLHNMLDNGCKVLDIGCGSGTLTLAFAKRYPNTFFTGLEVSEDSLTKANKSVSEEGVVSNITFKHGSTTDLYNDTNDKFDVVLLFQVLHNLPDPLKLIDEIERILKPGGKLILLEGPNHSSHADNIGDMNAAFHYSISQFYCLPFSMSAPPYIGYGVSWGHEAILEALGKYFALDRHVTVTKDFDVLFCLTKIK